MSKFLALPTSISSSSSLALTSTLAMPLLSHLATEESRSTLGATSLLSLQIYSMFVVLSCTLELS